MQEIELTDNRLLTRPAIKTWSRILYREMSRRYGDEYVDAQMTKAKLSSEALWKSETDSRFGSLVWTYGDWFRFIQVAYSKMGPTLGVDVSKHIGTSAYPLMEELIASAPDYESLINFWATHYGQLEPLCDLGLSNRGGSLFIKIDYPLRGKVREAFALSATAMCLQLLTSMTGGMKPEKITINFVDSYNVFPDWADYWSVPITVNTNQSPMILFEVKDRVARLRNVGYHPVRYSAAVDRYHLIVKDLLTQVVKVTTVESATALMKTSRQQFTRAKMAKALGITEKRYGADLSHEGLTHKSLTNKVNRELHAELTDLGYDTAHILKAMGIDDKRRLDRLLSNAND